MATSTIDELLAAIRQLPLDERRALIERATRDAAHDRHPASPTSGATSFASGAHGGRTRNVDKGRDLVVAAKARTYLTQLGRFTTSAVSVAEIIYGFRRIGREDRVSQFEASLMNAEVQPFDAGAARQAGRINADLETKRAHYRHARRVITGIALHHQLPLVTGTFHFG